MISADISEYSTNHVTDIYVFMHIVFTSNIFVFEGYRTQGRSGVQSLGFITNHIMTNIHFLNNEQQTIEYCPRVKYFNRKKLQKAEIDAHTAAFLLRSTRMISPLCCANIGNFQHYSTSDLGSTIARFRLGGQALFSCMHINENVL